MDVNSLIIDYYQKNLFVFFPNICNSSCEFCYVQPIKGKSAKLSTSFLNNFSIILKQAKDIGFDTIRITGGEPLIFNNFNKIILLLKEFELKYTLLTNAQNLNNHLSNLNIYPPDKITVSIHSIVNYYQIFKNKINFKELFSSFSKLKKNGVTISITTLFLKENENEINKIFEKLDSEDIDSFKFIYPNNYKYDLRRNFEKKDLSQIKKNIRATDFEQKECLLLERGFLSIIVENLKIYNCCTNVGEIRNEMDYEEFDLKSIIVKQFINNKKINGLPCSTDLESCPISLKEQTKGNNV